MINQDNDDDDPFDRILKIYDPVVVGPEPEFTRTVQDQVYDEDDRWWHLATGDLDNDGRDEIVVVTYPDGDWESYFYVYDPWDDSYPCGGFGTKNYYVDDGFANGLTVADTDDDGLPEIVFITSRDLHEDDRGSIYWVNGQTCTTILERERQEGLLFDVAAGDVNGNGEQEAIVAMSPGEWDEHDEDSLRVWADTGSSLLYDQFNWPGWGWGFYIELEEYDYDPPYWGFVASGDLNDSGDEEIVAIRNTKKWNDDDDNHLLMKDLYYSGDGISKTYDTAVFDGIATGDFEGIGRDYVALMSPNLPGVYLYDLGTKPRGGLGVSDDGQTVTPLKTYQTGWGDDRPKVMAVGDFDGPIMLSSSEGVAFTFFDDGTPYVDQVRVDLVYTDPDLTVAYTATESPPVDWLTVSPDHGTLPVDLVLDATFPGGVGATEVLETYTTTVVITGTAGEIALRGSPKELDITLNIVDELFLSYFPAIFLDHTSN